MDNNTYNVLSHLSEMMHNESIVKDMHDLQVGDIVYYDMDRADGIIPKDGYDSRLKYVNSDNDFSASPDWQAEQYLIRQIDYPEILDHDSWIDCTDPKELKVSKIKAKKAEKMGHLNAHDLQNVMKHLKENDFIDTHTRKVYGIDKFTISDTNE